MKGFGLLGLLTAGVLAFCGVLLLGIGLGCLSVALLHK